MGFLSSDNKITNVTDARRYDQRSYNTETNDSRKVFEGGGSDFSGVETVTINDGSAQALQTAHDSVSALADITKSAISASSKSVYDSLALAGNREFSLDPSTADLVSGSLKKILIAAAVIFAVFAAPKIVGAFK